MKGGRESSYQVELKTIQGEAICTSEICFELNQECHPEYFHSLPQTSDSTNDSSGCVNTRFI